MMGHTANAPCPLCSFTKPTGEGAHYAGMESSRAAALVRTTGRTLAVVGAVKDLLASDAHESQAGNSTTLASRALQIDGDTAARHRTLDSSSRSST